MKKSAFLLVVALSLFNLAGAQNLLDKVPSHASVVIKYSGKNFSRNMPLSKLETYSFVKENLFKALKIDSVTSLQNIGIDFEKDSYQYITTEDSAMSLVTLVHVNNVGRFISLIDANYQAELKPEKMNGYEFLAISADTYVGWNNEEAIFVMSNYSNPNSNRYYSYDEEATMGSDSVSSLLDSIVVSAEAATIIIDTAVTSRVDDESVEEMQKDPVVKDKKGKSKKKKEKAPLKKKIAPPKEVEEEVVVMEEESIYDVTDEAVTSETLFNDSVQLAKREARELEQAGIVTARQKKIAATIIANTLSGKIISINSEVSYNKIVDPTADASVWLNYENLLTQYWLSFFGAGSPLRNFGTGEVKVKEEKDIAFRSSMNMYFEKDKVRIEQKSFSPDEEMAKLGRQLFKSKQSKRLVNFVNPDNIGYLSMSVNTEAMADYYYRMIKQYLSRTPYINQYADLVDVYIDFLEIMIDEKAIADLMPGNYLFVLHDMKTKQVSYTTYEYDDDFKSTEVKKTRQEISPNFTFVLETKKDGFMEKLAKLPIKYAKEGKYNYQDRNGYYELVFDSGKNIFNGLYFMVKDGSVIITTSKKSIDIAMGNTGYTLDADTRKSILKNNYSMNIHSKTLIQQLGPEVNAGVNKKVTDYLQQNLGDIKMEGSLKNGMMQGTTTMSITGKHDNSFAFFFNMIDDINKIMEKDREVQEEKFN